MEVVGSVLGLLQRSRLTIRRWTLSRRVLVDCAEYQKVAAMLWTVNPEQ